MQLEFISQSSFGYIYKITNKINGKVYIGQTINLNDRWKHYRNLHCKSQPKIYNALKKYGVDSFLFTVIDDAQDIETLNFLEEIYIACFDSIETGYNSRPGGLNTIPTNETKRKMSQARKGKHLSDETKRKISLSRVGRFLSPEHKQKISEAQTGIKKKPCSEETKQKISRSHLGIHSGNKNPMYGRDRKGTKNGMFGHHQSEETKRRISEQKKLGFIKRNLQVSSVP